MITDRRLASGRIVTNPPRPKPAPSANAIALAKEIIIIKASAAGFDAVGPAVIEKVKSLFLQTNPMLQKDLNEVAAKLRAGLKLAA